MEFANRCSIAHKITLEWPKKRSQKKSFPIIKLLGTCSKQNSIIFFFAIMPKIYNPITMLQITSMIWPYTAHHTVTFKKDPTALPCSCSNVTYECLSSLHFAMFLWPNIALPLLINRHTYFNCTFWLTYDFINHSYCHDTQKTLSSSQA